MARGAWLTPNTPSTGFICRRLLIPNGIDFLAIVTGALLDLTYSFNFEQFDTLTPEQTAEYFRTMLEDFTFDSDGGCRMVGEIIPYAGPTSPNENWLVCDGRSLLRADYPELFAVISNRYGVPDGTHFNIPNLGSRTIVGVGQGIGLTERMLADTGGQEDEQLLIDNLPSHNHSDNGHTHGEGVATPTVINGGLEAPAESAFPGFGLTNTGYADISYTGGDVPFDNMPPWIALNYLIVAR